MPSVQYGISTRTIRMSNSTNSCALIMMVNCVHSLNILIKQGALGVIEEARRIDMWTNEKPVDPYLLRMSINEGGDIGVELGNSEVQGPEGPHHRSRRLQPSTGARKMLPFKGGIFSSVFKKGALYFCSVSSHCPFRSVSRCITCPHSDIQMMHSENFDIMRKHITDVPTHTHRYLGTMAP